MVECLPALAFGSVLSTPYIGYYCNQKFKVIFGYIAKFKSNVGCETLALICFSAISRN